MHLTDNGTAVYEYKKILVETHYVPQIIPGDMERKHLAETVSRRDTVFGGDAQSMHLIFVGKQWQETAFRAKKAVK